MYKVLSIIVEDENGIHALYDFTKEDEKVISEMECGSATSDDNLDSILEDIKNNF